MADGRITIDIEIDGKPVKVVVNELKSLETTAKTSSSGIETVGKSLNDIDSKSVKKVGSDLKELDSSSKNSASELKVLASNITDINGKSLVSTSNSMEELSTNSKQSTNSIRLFSDSLADINGKSIDLVSSDLSDLSSTAQKSSDSLKGIQDSAEGINPKPLSDTNEETRKIPDSANKASSSIKDIAMAMGLVKVASIAISALNQSMDAAISRFDTFQRFPKVMDSFGYSTSQAKEAQDKLSSGIDGLPTRLDEVVNTSMKLTTMTGNLDRSTNATLALNNAFLASGSSTADAARGTDQYVQMLSKGEVDLQSWKTLQETMPVGLQKTAEAMGFTGTAAQRDLYSALKEGDVTFREFEDNLIKLGIGTGDLANLAKINSEGMATSFGNLRNAVSKGVANLLTDINNLSKAVTGKSIAQNLDGLKVIINSTFKVVGVGIRATEPLLKVFIGTVNTLITTGKTLSPVLIGLGTAFLALKVINSTTSMLNNATQAINVAKASSSAFGIVIKGQTAATIADTVATKGSTSARLAEVGVVKLSTALLGVLTGSLSVSTVATTVMTTATTALGVAVKTMTGGVRIAIAAIGVLVTAGVSLYKWFNRTTEEGKKLNGEVSELSSSTDKLTDSVKNNSASRKDEIKHNESVVETYKKMTDEIGNLASKENKSAAEKKLLKDNVEALNKQYEGLNLVYDDESRKLSMSTAQIKEKIDAYSGIDKATQLQEQLIQAQTEEIEVGKKLEENKNLRAEWNTKLEEGTITTREHKKAIEELDEKETSLKETASNLKVETGELAEAQKVAAEQATQAVEEGATKQVITYEGLNEAQKAAVDGMKETWSSYADSATNMFDTLSDKQEMSVSQMQANLEENQRVVGEWGNNIAELAKRGVDQGLLNTLREAGPQSAGYVAAIVNSSDEELQQLSSTFANGGKTATDALGKAMGIEQSNIPAEIQNMIGGTKLSLKNKISEANFGELGKNVGDGLAQGITQNSETASKASKDMADKVSNSAKDALQVHSPSRVFDEIGGFVVAGLVQGIENKKEALTAVMDSLKTTLTEPFKDISVNSATSMEPFINGIKTGMDIARNSVSSNLELIKQDFNNFNLSLTGLSLTAMTGFNSTLQTGMTTSSSIIQSGITFLQSSFNLLPNIANQSMLAFVASISLGMATGASTINAGASTINSSFVNLQTTIKTSSSVSMTGFVSNLQSGMNSGNNIVSTNTQAITKQVDNLGKNIENSSKNSMNNMVQTINAGSVHVLSTVTSMVNNSTDSVNTLQDKFYQSGQYASQGLANGIDAGASYAIASARSLADAVSETLKDAMDIHSPSRRMRDEIGRYIPRGIAAGIDEDAYTVENSLKSISNDLLKPFNPNFKFGVSGTSSSSQNDNSPNSSSNNAEVVALLNRQNELLSRILAKDSSLIVDGEVLANIVNENNAINDSIKKF
ncbi:hypothetical protein BG261_05340 [Floricoccus tropicus]|uniref:Tape measure protein N-terminal domain-containing protein n=1 Tax=Floricoccus tropicus TaxID=1859473 RepID=A0A1E8GKN9_9LACT|nr:tape measure protein [Floricoccus tropicus]OFI48814.1 hypothetical protein BG261_05340 [Floricoccus tropicus]